MDKLMFIAAFVICVGNVYCNYDEEALRTVLKNQVREFQFASNDESDVQAQTCDCSYRNNNMWKSGGCQIIIAAPPGYACYCRYKGFWTCGGKVVDCLDKNNYYCQHPDRSKESCNQGGGNCGGYQ